MTRKCVSDYSGEVITDESKMVTIIEDGVEYRLKDLAEAKEWFKEGKPRKKLGGVKLLSDWSGEIVDEDSCIKVRFRGQEFVFKDTTEVVEWWQEQLKHHAKLQ